MIRFRFRFRPGIPISEQKHCLSLLLSHYNLLSGLELGTRRRDRFLYSSIPSIAFLSSIIRKYLLSILNYYLFIIRFRFRFQPEFPISEQKHCLSLLLSHYNLLSGLELGTRRRDRFLYSSIAFMAFYYKKICVIYL